MLVSDLISRAKFEAKSNATDDFDTWLLQVIQEEYLALHSKHNYDDFLVEATPLVCSEGVQFIALPTDFLRLESNARLKFYILGESNYTLLTLSSNLHTQLVEGIPQYYRIKNSRIYLYPYNQVLATHRIAFSYYKRPTTLTTASIIDDRYANVILHKAMSRLLIYKESKAAAFYEKKANDKFQDSL